MKTPALASRDPSVGTGLPRSASGSWTLLGVGIAIFGLPAIVGGYYLLVPERTAGGTAVRELLILMLTLALLWIVRTKEKLPLSSIGIFGHRPGRSLVWALALTIVIFASLIAVLAAFGWLGLRYGEGEGSNISPSIWVTLLTVIRAGVSEEIFYRGFAIERLQSITGSRWIAAVIPLLAFAGFHFRQGIAGVLLALILGAILTGFYLWKRDLVAAMLGHFLVDFVPNVLLPLLGGSE